MRQSVTETPRPLARRAREHVKTWLPAASRWGGLMRGAVSVALIYRYFDPHGAAALDGHRSTLITTTLLLVLFSTMVLGGLTKPLLDYIQGPAGYKK